VPTTRIVPVLELAQVSDEEWQRMAVAQALAALREEDE
jgi:hypothetical protein